VHVADSKNSRGLALTTTLSTAVAAQGLVTQKNISLAMAPTIAQAAVAQCESMGFKVSVTVVDPAGLPIVMLRGDGAGLHTPEGAERKAYTARTFSQPSADFVKRLTERPETVGSRQYTCWRWPADCRSRQTVKSLARSVSPVRPARMTSARKPASIKLPIS
jgi:hypothetical protein